MEAESIRKMSVKLKRSFSVSAPGKVILFGEHSVVYGKQAVAFSVGLRTKLTVSPATDGVNLHLKAIDIDKTWSLSTLKDLLAKIKTQDSSKEDIKPISNEKLSVLRNFLGIKTEEIERGELGLIAFLHLYTSILSSPVPFSLNVESDMPVSAGLGSSAAYGVCLAGTLLYIAELQASTGNNVAKEVYSSDQFLSKVSQCAFSCETVLHGTPSGIDNTICTYGGGLSFKSGSIKHLSPPHLTVMLVNTGVTRNTKTLVYNVREKHDNHQSIIEPILISMDNLAISAVKTIKDLSNSSSPLITDQEALWKSLQHLIDINQSLLGALGVSHPRLDEMVTIAKKNGLHAKLTGAGGGGFGLILLPPFAPPESILSCQRELESKKFEIYTTVLGGPGITFTFST